MKLDPRKFAEFVKARAKAGDGYIMCAVGQDPKTQSEWYFSGQYKGDQLKKANEWRKNAERVWDCQGLADGYVSEMLGKKINVRARNNYAEWCDIKGCGRIPVEYRVPGAAVFMDDDYVHHVGYLIESVVPNKPEGDWVIGEARGVMHGVVLTKMYSRSWNKWGWMTKYFEYDELPAIQTPPALENTRRTLRRGMVGADVAELQKALIALNYSCGRWGADGEFGAATESTLMAFQCDHDLKVDGIAGQMTFAKLDELLMDHGDAEAKPEAEKDIVINAGSSWNVRTQPNAQAPVLGYAKRGEAYAGSGQASDGWIGIMYNGEMAWVSAKALA